MTSHHDVAGVVAQLRAISGYPIFRDFGDGAAATTSLRTAADLLESQAKALSEAEDDVDRADKGMDVWMKRALAAEARLADKEAELSIARQINHDLTDGITGTLQKDKIESLETFRTEAMKAIEPLLNAKALAGVRALVAGWNGEGRDEPYKERHPYRLGATLPTCCGAVYELDEAMEAARAFTNAAKEKT